MATLSFLEPRSIPTRLWVQKSLREYLKLLAQSHPKFTPWYLSCTRAPFVYKMLLAWLFPPLHSKRLTKMALLRCTFLPRSLPLVSSRLIRRQSMLSKHTKLLLALLTSCFLQEMGRIQLISGIRCWLNSTWRMGYKSQATTSEQHRLPSIIWPAKI